MAAVERRNRKSALKCAAGTRSVAHLTKTLTGCTAFGITDPDREAGLSSQERRDGPAIKQLALPTVLTLEECGSITPATGKDVLNIKNLGPIAGPRIPDVQPLIRAVVLPNLTSSQRLSPRKVGD